MITHMLIVDDDTALTRILALHFADAGFTVTEASNCRDTLALIASSTFKIALLDYQLPDGTALDLVPALREADPLTPIIIMSGTDDPTLEERVRANSVHHLLRKPLKTEELNSLMQQVLNEGS